MSKKRRVFDVAFNLQVVQMVRDHGLSFAKWRSGAISYNASYIAGSAAGPAVGFLICRAALVWRILLMRARPGNRLANEYARVLRCQGH